MIRTNSNIEEKVVLTLNKFRKFLREDGGDVEFVRFEEETSVLEVRLTGNCHDCPLSLMTLRAGIERFILNEVPEVRRVESVK